MSTVYAALTVHDRVGTGFHLTQIFIGTLVNPSNHFQVVVQNFIEVTAFGSGFCQNHRQVQGNRTDIEASHKYRLVICVRRLHAATLKPRGEECTATHRAYNSTVLFVHLSHIAVTRKGKPVGIHGLATAINTCFKHILIEAALTVKVFVIEENQFREQYGLLESRLTLTLHVNFEEGLACHLAEYISSQSEGHSDERIITTGRTHSVQLHLNTLEALLIITLYLAHSPVFYVLGEGLLIANFHVLSAVLFVGLLCIRSKNLVHLRDSEAAVLL